MAGKRTFTNLGLTATSERNIKPGKEYEKYFSAETGKVELLRNNGNTYDTIHLMKEWVEKFGNQCAKVAPVLKGNTLYETCRNIEKWQMEHFRYRMDGLDPERLDAEEIHTPNKQWQKRNIGIDCDDFAIMASSILSQLKIPHFLRKADYGRGWQHVYVIVPLSQNFSPENRDSYYCIDPVVDGLNQEKKFYKKYDVAMKIYGLSGVGSENTVEINFLEDVLRAKDIMPLITRLNGLGNDAELDEQEIYARVYNSLVKTYNAILLNDAGVSDTSMKLYPDERERQAWLSMYKKAINAWFTDDREKVLKELDEETKQLFADGVVKTLSTENGDLVFNADMEAEMWDVDLNHPFQQAAEKSLGRVYNLSGLGLTLEEMKAQAAAQVAAANAAATANSASSNYLTTDKELTAAQIAEIEKLNKAAAMQTQFETDFNAYKTWYGQTWEILYKIANGMGSRTSSNREKFNAARKQFRWTDAPTKLTAILNKYSPYGLFTQADYDQLKAATIDLIDQQIEWKNLLQTVWSNLVDLIKAVNSKIVEAGKKALWNIVRHQTLTTAARSAVMKAFEFNYRGLASAVFFGTPNGPTAKVQLPESTRAEYKEKYEKAKKVYVNLLGGKEEEWNKAIYKGYKQDIPHPKTLGISNAYESIFGKSNNNPQKLLGVGVGLGQYEAAAIAGYITAGAAAIASIATLIASIKSGDPIDQALVKGGIKYCETLPATASDEEKAACAEVLKHKDDLLDDDDDGIPDGVDPDGGDGTGLSTTNKILLGLGLGAVIGGAIYVATKDKKEEKPAVKKHNLNGVKKGAKKVTKPTKPAKKKVTVFNV